MAQRIVTVCDVHQAHDAEAEGFTWQVTIAAPGAKAATYEVDLCEDDGKGLQDLLDMLADIGRRTDSARGPRGPYRKSQTAQAALDVPDGVPVLSSAPPTNYVGPLACPMDGCDKVAKQRKSLSSHLRQVHQVSIQEAYGEALPFTCDDCDRKFPNAQGVGVHRKTAHGASGAAG